jgi:hypothetical protein
MEVYALTNEKWVELLFLMIETSAQECMNCLGLFASVFRSEHSVKILVYDSSNASPSRPIWHQSDVELPPCPVKIPIKSVYALL